MFVQAEQHAYVFQNIQGACYQAEPGDIITQVGPSRSFMELLCGPDRTEVQERHIKQDKRKSRYVLFLATLILLVWSPFDELQMFRIFRTFVLDRGKFEVDDPLPGYKSHQAFACFTHDDDHDHRTNG